MSFTIKLDHTKTSGLLDQYRDQINNIAVSRALNKTAVTVRAEVSRSIAQDVGLPINLVRRAIKLKDSTPRTLLAIVRATGQKRIPIGKLGARETRRGVSFRIAGKSVEVAQAFIVEGTGRKRAVIRAVDARAQIYDKASGRRKRIQKTGLDYPIAELFAPGIPTAFVNRRIFELAERIANLRFPEALRQEIRFATLSAARA